MSEQSNLKGNGLSKRKLPNSKLSVHTNPQESDSPRTRNKEVVERWQTALKKIKEKRTLTEKVGSLGSFPQESNGKQHQLPIESLLIFHSKEERRRRGMALLTVFGLICATLFWSVMYHIAGIPVVASIQLLHALSATASIGLIFLFQETHIFNRVNLTMAFAFPLIVSL